MPWGVAAAAVVGAVASSSAADKAARAQENASNSAAAQTNAATAQARGDLESLFGSAAEKSTAGYQGAIDTLGQVAPQQADIYQQGNLNAQNTILAGLPQMQNALMGGAIDYSQFQPSQQIQPNFDFMNQSLTKFENYNPVPSVASNNVYGPSWSPTSYQSPLSGQVAGSNMNTKTNGMLSRY